MKPDTTTVRMTKRGQFWNAQVKHGRIPFTWVGVAQDTNAHRLEELVGQWYPKVMFDYPSTPRPQKGA